MVNHRCRALVLLALGSAFDASAQQTVGGTDQQAANSLVEIVVTAERRTERLQDVPLSVTALSPEALENAGITSTRDLGLITPGLRIEATGPYIQPSVRGITTTITNNVEPNIATYLDGVYQAATIGAIYNLPDIQQVEVLKGPQGTLFGRNATGGAILINTLNPDLGTTNGRVSVGYGSFETVTASSYVSAPIIQDRLAVSLTGYYEHMNGYQNNLVTGNHDGAGDQQWMLRGKIRFVPWDGADFTLTALTVRDDNNNILKFTSLDGNALGRAFVVPQHLPFATQPQDFAFDTDPHVYAAQTGVSLRGSIRLGPGALVTTSGYTDNQSRLLTDLDNTLAPIGYITVNQPETTLTQEFVYTTDQINRFHGSLGIFYFHADNAADPVAVHPIFEQWWKDVDNSYAAFTELTYDILDPLSVTAGVRYSEEHRASYWTNRLFGVDIPKPEVPFEDSATWHSTTPRVSFLYRATDKTNVYFTYSQGFKSGLFNENGLQHTPVNPETVDSYEIGVKSDVTPTLRVNAAVFHYKYSDLQVSALQGVTVVYQNAAQAGISGAELNTEWNALDGLKLSIGATYLHARYNSFPNANICTPLPGGGNNCNAVEDATGNTMVRAPDFSGNLTGVYSWSNSAGGFDVSATLFYSTKVYEEVADRIYQPAYYQLNASADWRPRNGNLDLKLWGRNLTNRDIIESTTITVGGDEAVYAPPRAIGIEASYKF